MINRQWPPLNSIWQRPVFCFRFTTSFALRMRHRLLSVCGKQRFAKTLWRLCFILNESFNRSACAEHVVFYTLPIQHFDEFVFKPCYLSNGSEEESFVQKSMWPCKRKKWWPKTKSACGSKSRSRSRSRIFVHTKVRKKAWRREF